jgi:tetratricopeptide (TPR) repeat protein
MTAASSPGLQQTLRSVESALRSGDTELALRLSSEATDKGLEHSHLLTLAAHHQLALNAPARALEMAMRARDLAPRNVDVLNVVGLSLSRLGRLREAVDSYEAALRQSPGAVMVRMNKASALEDLSELPRARREFERVLDTQPAHAGALASLANLAALRGDMTEARKFAGRALQVDPRQAAAHIALAQADIADEKFEAAQERLEPFTRETNPSVVNRSIALGLSGEALEGLGETARAFSAYATSQALLRAYYKPAFERPEAEAALARALRLTDYFRSVPEGKWRASADAPAAGGKTHVFFVGFPRSGTTLLEQALAGHPDIETLEEKDCLIDAATDFVLPSDGLDRLADMRDEDIEPYRKAYWKRAAAEGATLDRPVFVDKLPLNAVLLCLVAKLFPRARILFAVRDPRDVVFSCFRRRFVMTQQMYELTTLEGAAVYYDAVMQLSELYRSKFGLSCFDVRYEDLVRDFDATTDRLCTFLGLPWNEGLRGFAARAQSGLSNTPSAPQVARGLFTQGVGQWRRYRSELAGVLPTLAPWVSHFGYAPD